MNEKQTGDRVKHYLNQGMSLNPRVMSRLQAARDLALKQQRIVVASRPALVWVNNIIGRSEGAPSLLPRLFFPTIVLIFGLITINAWRQAQIAEEIEEIDAAVLTGDLPIDAYMDTGFDAWLKRSSQ